MAHSKFDFDVWWNQQYLFIDNLHPLYKALNNQNDIEYVEFLRHFVFPSARSGRFRLPRGYIPLEKVFGDVQKAIKAMKKLYRHPLDKNFKGALQKLVNLLSVWEKHTEEWLRPKKTLAEFGEFASPRPTHPDYPHELSYIRYVIRTRKERLTPLKRAIAEVDDYQRNDGQGRVGRPSKKIEKIMVLALTRCLRNRIGKPSYPLVKKFIDEHFKTEISYGSIRAYGTRASKADTSILRNIDTIFKNRHRLRSMVPF